jgi:uncharacterized protein YgiM (DUF1202 family)
MYAPGREPIMLWMGIYIKAPKCRFWTAEDGWYKISAGSLTGWVSGDYLKVHSLERVRVTKELVNLRSGPSTAHAVIGQAVKGDVLTLVGTEGDWYQGAETRRTNLLYCCLSGGKDR